MGYLANYILGSSSFISHLPFLRMSILSSTGFSLCICGYPLGTASQAFNITPTMPQRLVIRSLIAEDVFVQVCPF